MLKVENLSSWEDFESAVKNEMYNQLYDGRGYPVFRGQPDTEMNLKTTLERSIGNNLSVENYFNIIKRIKNKVETFTNQRWDLPDYDKFQETINTPSRMDFQTYIYMTYLRHFGFPSPLLDWTKSPFVAAYFAFRDTSRQEKPVAIYMYEFRYEHLLMPVYDFSHIFPIVISPKDNKRHELQQGIYTICLKEEEGITYFANHEEAGIIDEHREPFVTKYILPASERYHALHNLKTYNINSYSLFGTEESLLESLFLEKYISAYFSKKSREEYNQANVIDKEINVNDIWG